MTSAAVITPTSPAEQKRRSLSIGVLSYGLPVVGEKRGGIERVADELANGLAGRGHRVIVFSHDERPAGARYEVRPLPWRRFVNTWIGRRLTMGYLGNVLMALPDFSGLDVLMAHGDSLLLPLRRTPFVRVVHGSAWEEARSATSSGRFLLQAGVFAQELASAATHRASVGVSENTRRSNPFVRAVVPNGVNRAVFGPDPVERASYPMVLSVGAMSGRKRGAWLLDRFEAEIAPRVPGAQLHFVSAPGPDRPNVTYHQGVSDAELARLYRKAVGVRVALDLRRLRSPLCRGDGVRNSRRRDAECGQLRSACRRRRHRGVRRRLCGDGRRPARESRAPERA